MSRLSHEPLSPKARANYHRAQVLVHEAAGYPAMAQWHREMAEWLAPTPRYRAPVVREQERPLDNLDFLHDEYLRANNLRRVA